MDSFNQFKLSPATLTAIAQKGYTVPSPIQVLAIPPLLSGSDLIGQAQTGTGKTAAFGIPLIETHGKDDSGRVVSLTLVPTRELALQVTEELTELARGSRLKIVSIYGGVGFGNQLKALEQRGTMMIVATPGRLLDHIERGTLHLDDIKTLILDEADRMLDMGFVRDVERIMKCMPQKRQTALFSATISAEIQKLSKRYLTNPQTVRVESPTATVDSVQQYQVGVHKEEKQAALLDLLHAEAPERAIVFTRTKHLARRLSDRLQKGGWGAVALQGNMSQSQRERALAQFRDGQARILVATDVAARGLDIPEVSHVVNYDVPDAADAYVHRIGRTARMGRAGRAITFIQPDERNELRDIERVAGSRLQHLDLQENGGSEKDGPDLHMVPVLQQRPEERRQQRGPPQHRTHNGGGGGGPKRFHGGGQRRQGGAGRKRW